jgi:hypothetical protein
VARDVTLQINSLQKWINRRKSRGTNVTSDMVWEEIKRSWSWIDAADREKIFQGVKF